MEKDMTIEESFTEIEAIISKLEDENISLEDSFEEYKKGMELVKLCNDKIDKVEKKVMALGPDGELDEFE